MRRSLILLPLALLLLSGSQPPVGCRVNPATVEWTEERTLPAYTGTEPLTTIHLDLCCFVSRTLQYENLGVFQGAAWDVHSSPVVLQASDDNPRSNAEVCGKLLNLSNAERSTPALS